jgi:drug/metabolite transporter (DMT)-like permease
MTQLLALLSAALFGVADFAGGLATKRISAWTVAGWSQVLGIPILILGLMIVPSSEVTTADLGWGAVGGVFGILGVAVMYMALAAGTMSVIAPIIGVGAGMIPVIWAVVTGESIDTVQWAGIAIAGVAVMLIASQSGAGRLSTKLALQAFGAFAIIVATRTPVAPGRALIPLVATVAVFDMTANIAIVLAVQRGPIGINAVLGSLYPAFTVIAAIVVLKERPTRRQIVGLSLALVAVLALAL